MWPRANTFKHMFRPWPMKPKDIWRYCFFASPFQHPICQLKLNKRISSCPGSWAARLTHLLWAEISVLIQYVIIEVLRKHTSLHVHCTYIYIYTYTIPYSPQCPTTNISVHKKNSTFCFPLSLDLGPLTQISTKIFEFAQIQKVGTIMIKPVRPQPERDGLTLETEMNLSCETLGWNPIIPGAFRLFKHNTWGPVSFPPEKWFGNRLAAPYSSEVGNSFLFQSGWHEHVP